MFYDTGKFLAICGWCEEVSYGYNDIERICYCRKTNKIFQDFVIPKLKEEGLYLREDLHEEKENERQVYRLNMIML